MKYYLLIILCLVFSSFIIARNDVDLSTFNKHMMEDMEKVIEDNPEIYDKKNIGRVPASENNFDTEKNTTEKLDKFDYQADGPENW